ncbi:hypothetical protein D8M04_19435 [Oceanobacillus piezotolerans]|uniref:Uncharacterized protein n=1 Tax=Oceanobacillus piezotolerans TaxID=2448030 RepID=A0A498D155_9BACI|nr:hypothetical protein [Oceanobacillus piezotolerans]RLL40116.1 hypothetical protein D8M04_19435 [Oceanobacillus piezotolerans]
MKTDTSFTLNFMIYIQNIFLNQSRSEEELRFPYLSTRIAFKEDFELRYKKLWNEVSQRITSDVRNDLKIFYEEKDLLYQKLFENNADSLAGYNEVYKTFQVWWDSFAGRFSVERSTNNIGQNLYVELVNYLKKNEIEPQRQLSISIIYDECLLANAEVSSYFAVLPIRDFFFKFEELVPKLKGCFY